MNLRGIAQQVMGSQGGAGAGRGTSTGGAGTAAGGAGTGGGSKDAAIGRGVRKLFRRLR